MRLAASLFDANPQNADIRYSGLRTPQNETAQRARDDCDRLWRIYSSYCNDPNFVSDFPIRFHERWFEMSLTAHLLELGAQVQHTKPPGPDVLVNADGRCIWIEAICGTGGQPGKPNTVPPPSRAGYIPFDNIALRIRSAIEEKRKKYDIYLKQGIVKGSDRLLIAVNIADIPHANLDVKKCVFRSLYGLGDQVIKIDRSTLEQVSSSIKVITSIAKASGSPVGMQPFIDGSMDTISGALIAPYGVVASAHDGHRLDLYPNLSTSKAWRTGDIALDSEWRFHTSGGGWLGERFDR
jgi:hypothetical protein